MKTDLAPKFSHVIDEETIILWFLNSNRYVVVTNDLHTLINVFLNTENQTSFVKVLNETFHVEYDKCHVIFNEISAFLKDANKIINQNSHSNITPNIPLANIEVSYDFNGKTVKINYESSTIQSIIHPQIAHHATRNIPFPQTCYDIFKTNDDLHLFKDKNYIESYKTSMFHFLQGKFALQLTNTIHNKLIDNWIATFHASTVTNGNEAIMIIGHSGNGKSTLSALLMANGLDLLADDFTPLYKDLNLYRYPAAVSVKKGAFPILKEHIKDFNYLETYTNGPKKVNIKYVPPISNYKTNAACVPCSKIVFVKYDHLSESSLHETSVASILETLIPESWISPNELHATQFLNWLKNLKCYELNYSDNDFAISKFKSLFD